MPEPVTAPTTSVEAPKEVAAATVVEGTLLSEAASAPKTDAVPVDPAQPVSTDPAKGDPPKDPATPTTEPVKTEVVGAPEKYELKLPDGVEIKADRLETIQSEFKKHNLTQAAAQDLINLQSKFALDQQKAAVDAFSQTVKGWREDTIKELGSDYKTELSKAAKALDQFGSPELKKLFNDSGFGNHPKVISFLRNVEKAISQDVMTEGRPGNFEEKSAADTFYPNLARSK